MYQEILYLHSTVYKSLAFIGTTLYRSHDALDYFVLVHKMKFVPVKVYQNSSILYVHSLSMVLMLLTGRALLLTVELSVPEDSLGTTTQSRRVRISEVDLCNQDPVAWPELAVWEDCIILLKKLLVYMHTCIIVLNDHRIILGAPSPP